MLHMQKVALIQLWYFLKPGLCSNKKLIKIPIVSLSGILVNKLQTSYDHLQNISEKLHKLRKSCNQKRNINGIYNEKLHYTFF